MGRMSKNIAFLTAAAALFGALTVPGSTADSTALAATASIESQVEVGTLGIGGGGFVSGIITGEDSYIATGNFQIQAEDRVVVLVLPKTIQAVEKLFR